MNETQPFVDSASIFTTHGSTRRTGRPLHQGDRAGQRRANIADVAAAADPGRPHRVAHQAEVQRLAVRRAAAGPLPDAAYELNAALVMCQASAAAPISRKPSQCSPAD